MIEVDLTGVEELNQKFENIVKAIGKDKLKPILLKKAREVRTRLRREAPKGKTGNLRKGLTAKLLPDREYYPVVAKAGINWKRAPHAGLVEKGHGGPHPAPAHPFFGPVIDDISEQIHREVKQEIIALFEKVI